MSFGPLAKDFACPYCGAEVGDKCETARGKERDPHTARWTRRHDYLWRGGKFVVEMLDDDDRFGLHAGDQLIAQCYLYDNQKVTLLRRLADDYNPECNAYLHQIKFVQLARSEQ